MIGRVLSPLDTSRAAPCIAIGWTMQTRVLADLLDRYNDSSVLETIDPEDQMFNTSVRGWQDYEYVGRSAIQVITSVLAARTSDQVQRVMDFACGHGRVARFLRAMFPNAELFFSDIDEGAARFCAETFGGTAIVSQDDVSKVELPGELDLIWVGSLFTHIDKARMESLWDTLFACLAQKGVLVATFRGRRMYDVTRADENQARKFADLLSQYERDGIGYQSYGRPEWGDWGLSLATIPTIVALGERHPEARLAGYVEAGWATVHDVASWRRGEI
jgi:SAM-dependent methyltransferase